MKHTSLTICQNSHPVQTVPVLTDRQLEALTWYAVKLRDAEISTGNPQAIADPGLYLDKMRATYSAVIGEVVKDWEKAGREGTRDEPVWKTAPIGVVPKRNAIALCAG